MATSVTTDDILTKELAYYKKKLDELTGINLSNEFTILLLKNQLRQKVQSFSVLAELQLSCSVQTPLNEIYTKVVQAISKDLMMDKALLLTTSASPDFFKPATWAGFTIEETPILEMREIEFSKTSFNENNFLLHNSQASYTTTTDLISWSFHLPYFIAVPVLIDNSIVAVLLAGRMTEIKPHHPPLDERDADTLIAIASMIATFLQNKRIVEFKMRIEQQLLEKTEIMSKFSQQVSRNVAEELVRKNIEYKSEKREVCIMFLDIRNFTPFSEKKEPEEVVKYLNALFDFMIKIIDKNHGIVNQFLGDGFMTTFGAPLLFGNSCQNAVNAALEIVEALKHNHSLGVISETRVGIGIHKGNAITGNIGSSVRRQYSITGNVVILASRIEQLTKEYSAQILVSSEVFNSIDHEKLNAERIGAVAIKGRSISLEIYKLA